MTTAYNGKCAFALSFGKTDVEGIEKHKLVKNDTAYLFLIRLQNYSSRFYQIHKKKQMRLSIR